MRAPQKALLVATICVLAGLLASAAQAVGNTRATGATQAVSTTQTTDTTPAPGTTQTAGTTQPDSRVIAPGVSAGGVEVGGLTVNAAEQKLAAALTPVLARQVVIGVAGQVFHFSPSAANLSLDAHTTAARAYYAGVKAAGAPVSVPLAIDQHRTAIQSFVAGVAHRVDVAPRNASLSITLTHLGVHRSATGHEVDEAALVNQLQATFDSPTAERVLHVKLTITHPAVNANQIEREDATVITVDRKNFKLRLFKNLRVVAEYGVAVGRSGLETPTGIYHVLEREVNPPWHVPDSSWAGSLAGTTVPPGPSDPIVARWMGLGGGIGIHGTDEPFSIGSDASHGCIRMRPADVIALYPRVPLGTTVYIK
jgi:lipoprotein-anchoring transpeptidase ErfK/SrfK